MPICRLRGAAALTLLVLPAFATGCSNDPPPAPGAAAPAAAAPASVEHSETAGPPETADAAVRVALEGLKQNRPQALWDFLPAGYQNDINDVVHSFAERMDPEIWDRAFQTIGRLARVLEAKKEFLLGGNGRPRDQVERSRDDLEAITTLLATIAASDLANLERLKTADVGAILETTGGRVMDQIRVVSNVVGQNPESLSLSDLAQTRLALKESSGDTAIVTMTAPGQPPRDVAFVRVEGKWIPQDLADGWIESIGRAKAMLSTFDRERLAEIKPQVLTLLTAIDGHLDKLAAARSREEFGLAMQEAIGSIQALAMPLMMAGLAGGQPPPTDDPAETPAAAVQAAELVTITVRGKLDAAAQDALANRLISLLGHPDPRSVSREITGDDETTTIRIGPVEDVEAFARQLEDLEVVSVDEATRTITAELPARNAE